MGAGTRGKLIDWRAELAVAAVRQGPSFATLLVILYGVWHFGDYLVRVGIPAHLEQIQAGYRELQETHDVALERLVATFEAEQDRLESVIGTLESLVENRAILEDTRQLLLQVLEELRRAARAKAIAAARGTPGAVGGTTDPAAGKTSGDGR